MTFHFVRLIPGMKKQTDTDQQIRWPDNLKWIGVFYFLWSLNLPAQEPVNHISKWFHQFVEATPDSVFDRRYARWKRAEQFWLRKLGPSGSFLPYEEAFRNYYLHFEAEEEQARALPLFAAAGATQPVVSTGELKFGNWIDLGPKQIEGNTHNMGRLDRVEADPDDPTGKTLYVMGVAGIFRTIDGGKTWRNLYTDTRFPVLCFTDMKLVKDRRTGKKYIYTAVGGTMLDYIEQAWGHEYGVPFYGLFRLELGTTQWQNLSGNLNSEELLGHKITSSIYKILVDPSDVSRVFLATTKGVLYSTRPETKQQRTTVGTGYYWKRSAFEQPALGLDFDYSDPSRKSLYCSFQQLYHTKDVYTAPFQLISSQQEPAKGVFDNYNLLPAGTQALNTTAAVISATSHVNVATSPAHPTKAFMSVTTVGEYMNGSALAAARSTALFQYSKTAKEAYPANFKVLDQHPGVDNHLDKNFIKVSPFSPNLICYNYALAAWAGGGGPRSALYDLNKEQVISAIPGMHDDLHDLCFGPGDKVYITSDGGVFSSRTKAPFDVQNHNGAGLNNMKFYGGSVWEKDGKKAMGGFHDNFTYETNDLYTNAGWRFVTYTGDGDKALYLPNGDVYFNSCYNDYPLYWRKKGETAFTTLRMPCRMGSVWQKVYKSPGGDHTLYITGEELYMARAPYTATNEACSSPFQPLTDYRHENAGDAANATCGQYFMSDFDISPDHKTIYALFFNNAGIWSSGCQKASGTYVPVIKTTVGGKNNPNVSAPCDGPSCWTNLPDMNTLKLKGNASCVAMNPANPDQVWIASSGYAFPDQPDFTRRAVYSKDGGKTFDDFSQGLPDVPVNRLIARKGCDYEIYAATDVGVYYRNQTMKAWKRAGTNLPYVITYDLQLDACNNKMYAYTFGRGMWSVDLPKSNSETGMPGLKIGASTTYSGTVYAMNGWIIPAGVTVTLKHAEVHMGPQTSIIVEPGAQLNIEDSELTCYCDNNTWKGVIDKCGKDKPGSGVNIKNTTLLGIREPNEKTVKK